MTGTTRRGLLATTTAVAGAAVLPAGRLAHAQSWPSRTIELVIGFAPGGGTDILARTLAPFLEKHIGNGAKIAVDNKNKPDAQLAPNPPNR